MNDQKDNFIDINADLRFVDVKLFNDIFNNIINQNDKINIKINTINFDEFENSSYIYALDFIFLSSRSDFSNLFKFSAFQCGDFHVLSEEFFNFYPIIKTYILNEFAHNGAKYFKDIQDVFDSTFKINEKY